MAFHPYPTEVPSADIITLVMDALLRKKVNWPEAAHATWHVAGFGLAQWDVHMPVDKKLAAVREAADSPTMTDEEAARALSKLAKRDPRDATDDAADHIPWELILPVLFSLLQRLLGG